MQHDTEVNVVLQLSHLLHRLPRRFLRTTSLRDLLEGAGHKEGLAADLAVVTRTGRGSDGRKRRIITFNRPVSRRRYQFVAQPLVESARRLYAVKVGERVGLIGEQVPDFQRCYY